MAQYAGRCAKSLALDLSSRFAFNFYRVYVQLPLRQKAKGAAALEVWAGVEWGVLAALAA